MALNKYMHKRNPFKDKRIDFALLASKYDFLKKAICGNDANDEIVVDFKSPAHLAAISRTLLLDAFNLDVFLPLDRLIPTIPLRMNYILWIEDLIQSTPLKNKTGVQILDIGSGAACIYGLLGARLKKWHFVATEIDSDNCVTARNNVTKNGLDDFIQVVSVSQRECQISILRPGIKEGGPYIDVVICNPPFFSSVTDKAGCFTTKNVEERDDAKSINTSVRSESVVEGGESYFAQRMINESFDYKDRVGIFTVMLGKKSSCDTVRHYLQSKDISNYSIYEMCQGRVMRWGVAWSFLADFVHPKSEFQLSKLNTKCTLSWKIGTDLLGLEEYSVNGVYDVLKTVCKSLDIAFLEQRNKQTKGGGHHLLITAMKDTWSHQRRRRRELQRQAKARDESECQEPDLKRRRVEQVCEESEAMDMSNSVSSDTLCDECVLRCTMNVATTIVNDLPMLQLDMTFLDGDKEAMNQVLTYVKNYVQRPR